MVENCRF